MGWFGKTTLRRSEVRRQKSEQEQTRWRRFRAQFGLTPITLGLLFFILATAIVLYGRDPFPYYEGQEQHEPILARLAFEVVDETATAEARQKAQQQTPNYYLLHEPLIDQLRGTITNQYSTARQYETYEAYQQAKPPANDPAAQLPQWQIDEQLFTEFQQLDAENDQTAFTQWIDQLVTELKKERLIRAGIDTGRSVPVLSDDVILQGVLPNPEETSLEGGQFVQVAKLQLANYSAQFTKRLEYAAERLAQIFPTPGLRVSVRQQLITALLKEDLLQYDSERTEKAIQQAAAAIEPLRRAYPAGSILAAPAPADKISGPEAITHLHYPLTAEQLRLLEQEHLQVLQLIHTPLTELPSNQRELARLWQQEYLLRQCARGAIVLLIVLGLVTYSTTFQSRIITRPSRALTIMTLFLLILAAGRAGFLLSMGGRYPFLLTGLVVIAAAIMTLIFAQRFALGITAALCLLLTLAVRGDLGLLLVLGSVTAVSIFLLREIRSRNELLPSGVLTALTALGVGLIVLLVEGSSLESALRHAAAGSISSFVAMAIFFIMLSPIEKIFDVVTNWTLLELLDTSQPLLSRLAREAPGTYAHCLWLSTMAEAACETIGANGLLAKVGAMYHDIGKIHKSEYFAENQEAGINRHDKLTPTMSLLVIIGHVKDGVELAHEEGLPDEVIQFIQEHHGTTVVKYFHHAASEQQKAAGLAREVSESEFRYPGPKPQCKETAVLMLCDGVEGAVRALPEPTAGRIENVVHNVLMDRLQDGQFDECDITLRELHRIEESLVKSLCRFYHGRVAYPKSTAPQSA
ncbi:MAG: hypothetical protein HJJLKODD_01860 [Phycisphaerae bacterium]|nr:hypothetical protein [Phycisphaerae bacterium]